MTIYTLLAAAVDRFFAVAFPLVYRGTNPRRAAKRVCACTGSLAVLAAAAPFWSEPHLTYGTLFGVVSTLSGRQSEYVYALSLALPIPVMWALSLTTFFKTHRHMARTKQMTSNGRGASQRVPGQESRLARTLLLMVAAFTASLFPAAAMVVVGMFTPGTTLYRPREFQPAVASRIYAGEFFSYLCLVTNTAWSFFIYNARNRRFRKAVRRLRRDVGARIADVTRSYSSRLSGLANRRRRRSKVSTASNSSGRTVTDSGRKSVQTTKEEVPAMMDDSVLGSFYPVGIHADGLLHSIADELRNRDADIVVEEMEEEEAEFL